MNRKSISIILGLFVSALLLYLAIKDLNFSKFLDVMRHVNIGMLLLILVLIGCFFGIKAFRWKLLLLPIKNVKISKLVPPMIIGVAFNSMVFGYLGEFVRMYFVSREAQLSKSSALATILLERMIDLFTVLILLGIALMLSEGVPDNIVTGGYWITFLGLFCIFMIVFAERKPYLFIHFASKCLKVFKRETRDKILEEIKLAIMGFEVISKPRLIIPICISSVIQWLCMAGSQYFSMAAIGITVPYYAAFLTMALLAFGIMLPSSPGHVGLVEFCFVIGLAIYGVSSTEAFSAAVIFHVILYSSVILLGVYYLNKMGFTLDQAKKKGEKFHL